MISLNLTYCFELSNIYNLAYVYQVQDCLIHLSIFKTMARKYKVSLAFFALFGFFYIIYSY